MTHVEDLLVAAREGELSSADAVRAKEHAAGCARCAGFDRALGRAQAVLRRPVPDLPLPELRRRSRAVGLTRSVVLVMANLGVLALALVVGLTLYQLRSGEVAGGLRDRALGFIDVFAHGGGALILVDESGRELRRLPLGLTFIDSIDPNEPPRVALHGRTGRVAIWRDRPQEPTPLADLLIWDGRELRVLATISELRPEWTVWSADGGTLYVVARTREAPTSRGPARAGLLAIDVRTAQVRTVLEYQSAWPLIPLFAADAFVAGVDRGWGDGSAPRYSVLAADTGRAIATWAVSERFGGLPRTDPEARLVAVPMRESHLQPPNALRVWRADDYSDHWVIAWDEIRSFQFVPGRGEVIVSGRRQIGGPFEIAVVDRSGRTRVLLTDERELHVGPVSPDGRVVAVHRRGGPTEGGHISETRTYDLKDGTVTERRGLINGERRLGPAIGWVAIR